LLAFHLMDFYDLYKLVQACISLYKSQKVFCKNADVPP